MRVFGVLVLLGYGFMAFGGYEPFSKAKRGEATGATRRGPSGGLFWFGGISGGK